MAGQSFKRAVATDEVWFGLPGPDGEEIRFDCLPVLPAGVILDFGSIMGAADGNGQSTGAGVPEALTALFQASVVDEQYPQFQDVIHDKRCGVSLQVLSEVAIFLAGQYTGERPTGASSAPISPKTESGNVSMGGALHGMSTYSRSKPPVLTP